MGLGRGGSGLRAASAVGAVRCSPGGGGEDGGGSVLPPGRQPRCRGRLVLRPLDGETDFLGLLLVLPSDVHACEVHGRGALGGRMQLRRDASTLHLQAASGCMDSINNMIIRICCPRHITRIAA